MDNYNKALVFKQIVLSGSDEIDTLYGLDTTGAVWKYINYHDKDEPDYWKPLPMDYDGNIREIEEIN